MSSDSVAITPAVSTHAKPGGIPDKAQYTIPEMPLHWRRAMRAQGRISPHALISRLVFALAFGQRNFEELWNMSFNEVEWRDYIDRLSTRLSNILIIAGLLLASFAALVTTDPPVRSALNYTEGAPYYCILVAFGFTLGAVTIGSGVVFVLLADFRASYFRDVLMGNRWMVVLTATMLAYPVMMIGYAFVFGTIGLLLATLPGHIHAVVGVGALILLGPLILVVIFLGAQLGMWQAVHGWFDD